MCGITGYIGHNEAFSQAMLEKMNASIYHRGPDEAGIFTETGVGLAMRRLSIIDLHGGSQPIYNEDKSVCVVFNGEIYNCQELRSRLIGRGHQFYTHSDTEVIVHAYEEYADDFVDHLRGMFAIALWDRKRKRAILARDRLGIKPLYYAEAGGALVFGSELKCILASGQIDKVIDVQAIDAFMTFTYIPAPLTIYKNIYKLEPGHLIVYEGGKWTRKQYWDLSFNNKYQYSEAEWAEKLEAEIDTAIKLHLMSDVPLGAFLSGGIDSSLVVAMMSRHSSEKVATFTMGFGGNAAAVTDERPYARLVAERYSTDYNDFTVTPDFRTIVDELLSSFDEPFADDSIIPSYYICKLTRKKVKVALSGLGGDELFGGYHRYYGFKLSQYYGHLPGLLHRLLIKPLVNSLAEPQTGGDRINHIKRFVQYADLPPAERYLAYVSVARPAERQGMYKKEIAASIDYAATGSMITHYYNNANAGNPMDRMYYTDIKTYLPDDILALSDRLSMKHSLELRVPLVDHKLVEFAAAMPPGLKIKHSNKKYILKKIARHYLPEAVIKHRKQGFESPMASWLKNDLKEYSNEVLSEANIEKTGVFDSAFVRQCMEQHYLNRQKNNKLIFSLMMFHLWAGREGVSIS